MPLQSSVHLDIPSSDILSYLFPPHFQPSEQPLWIESTDPSKYLSQFTLIREIKRFTLGLKKLGVRPGDVVMVLSGNHIYVPVVFFGVMACGAIYSGANPTYTVPELAYQQKDTEASIFLVHPNLAETAIAAATLAGLPKERMFLFADEPAQSIQGVKDWQTMLGNEREAESTQWLKLNAEQAKKMVATLNYSSGTTGLPKGVCTAHSSLIANTEQAIFMRNHGQDGPTSAGSERWVGFLPLYHAFGQLISLLMACRLNIPVYMMHAFQFEPFLQTLQDFKITHVQTAPPVMVMLNKRPETAKYDLRSLRNVLCGAAPLSSELQNAISAQLGVTVNQIYGMTELTCAAIQVPGGMVDDTGSVGTLYPNIEAKLLGDDGAEVGINEPGEMFLRGPNVCLRYWKNERATQETLDAEGWLKTGDVAVVNEKGFFWIVDRKKELIKVNGMQVAPAELEAVLLENDGVADAAVVGMAISGEEFPRGYVVLKESAQHLTGPQIQKWVEGRVAKHKHLQGGVAVVQEVPKNPSGKIARKIMREWAKRDAAVVEQMTPILSRRARL